MCGLAGIFTAGRQERDNLEHAVRAMAATIVHRGPDDSGTWSDPSAGVAFGFRRLSILDVSEDGHQPMVSASGRFVIVFNGEVYNFAELRNDLEAVGARFRGQSDTEVILAAFEQWGIEDAVRRFTGMFAMAVWQRDRRCLTLIRDRLGIKPLFVYAQTGLVTFGSELKSLLAGPSFDRSVDADALASYLRYLYVPAPRTIFRHAIKLRPGHLLTIKDPSRPLPPPQPFWSAEAAALAGAREPFEGSDDEAVAELDRLLTNAVGIRMRADVPLGALLSGGIDSSTTVAKMQALCSKPVKTFSIGFRDKHHNEAPYAARVAEHLGTDHTELVCTGDDALALVPKLADWFDEPHADPSQLPTFLVSQLARRQVTVAISGDGGDELFAGYNRYAYGSRLLPRMCRIPRPARQALGAGLARIPPSSWDRLYGALSYVRGGGYLRAGEKVHKVADLMGAGSVAEMYRSLVSAWQDPAAVLLRGRCLPGSLERIFRNGSPQPLLERMMLVDQLEYLPDDVLAKVDRVSMAVSLEVRVPILDHRIVEFSWRLPATFKLRDGQSKWILRQVLYRYVPKTLVDRPKMGFTVPIDRWLRGPLREWGHDLLSEDTLRRDGFLRPEPIASAWRSFQSGRREAGLALWAVLVFQSWLRRWKT